jgi:hypothetical protein
MLWIVIDSMHLCVIAILIEQDPISFRCLPSWKLFKDVALRYHGFMFVVVWWVHVAISLMLEYGHMFQNLIFFGHKVYS